MSETSNLRIGEEIVTCAGGKCAVCKNMIPAGKAVQLSRYTSTECLEISFYHGVTTLGIRNMKKSKTAAWKKIIIAIFLVILAAMTVAKIRKKPCINRRTKISIIIPHENHSYIAAK